MASQKDGSRRKEEFSVQSIGLLAFMLVVAVKKGSSADVHSLEQFFDNIVICWMATSSSVTKTFWSEY